jgi:hypothetical protein
MNAILTIFLVSTVVYGTAQVAFAEDPEDLIMLDRKSRDRKRPWPDCVRRRKSFVKVRSDFATSGCTCAPKGTPKGSRDLGSLRVTFHNVISGQKAPLGRILRNFRLRMRNLKLRNILTSGTFSPEVTSSNVTHRASPGSHVIGSALGVLSRTWTASYYRLLALSLVICPFPAILFLLPLYMYIHCFSELRRIILE